MKIKKIGWGFGLCNMNCTHCYNNSSMGQDIPRYSFKQLVSVATKVCPSVRDINFGTGELFCNPNTMRLIAFIAQNYPHIDMAITSNGYTIVKMKKIDIKRQLNDVDISVDFPDKQRHNEFRGHDKAWFWANRALKILQEIRIQTTITTCVTSQTTDEDLLGLISMANRYGACLRINWYRNTKKETNHLRISAERAWSVIELLADKVIFSSLDSIFAGPLGVKCQSCPAGGFSARIHQDMSVTAYPFLKGEKWSAGNILDPKVNMYTVFNSSVFNKLRSRNVSYCKECPFQKTCNGGCLTRAVLHNKGINDTDDFCPVRYKQMDTVNRIKGKIVLIKQGNLVHDGYLCTTIMKPKENM